MVGNQIKRRWQMKQTNGEKMKRVKTRWFHLCIAKRLIAVHLEKETSEGKQQEIFCKPGSKTEFVSNAEALTYLASKPVNYYWPIDDCDNRSQETGACMGHEG
jgi:hypothetical protein